MNLKGEFENRAKNYLQRQKAEQERAERKKNKRSTSAAAAQNLVSFLSLQSAYPFLLAWLQVKEAVARAMEPFMNQLFALGKDVRKLKGEASDDEESSSESSKEEPPKRQKTSTPAPTSTPRRKKDQKKTVKLPDPVQMDLSQVDDEFIQREAGASTPSVDDSCIFACAFFRSPGG